MEKILKVEGMMCPHCSGRVKKSLEELPEVIEAVVSHEDGTAKVILDKEVSYETLKKTIEDQGYKVIGKIITERLEGYNHKHQKNN